MGNFLPSSRRQDCLKNYSRLQQSPDGESDDGHGSNTLPLTAHSVVEIEGCCGIGGQQVHHFAEEQGIKELERPMKEEEERHQTLTTRIKQLERDIESLRNELEAERLSKERELLKMVTKREKEVAEHNKQLTYIKQELLVERQKSLFEQKEQCSGQKPGSLSLKHSSSVDPALKKNQKAYFRGFFLLRSSLLINGQPAEIVSNNQGWLSLMCPATNSAVTFHDLCTEILAAVEKCSGLYISNYWYAEGPVFQLNITSADSLKTIVQSKSQLQKQLSTKLSQMFNKETQVHLQSDIVLVLPSAPDRDDQIVQVTLDNAEECMEQWQRSATFISQAIFQQGNGNLWRSAAEPTLDLDNLSDIVCKLEDVTAQWFLLGVHLKVPYSDLQVIGCNHRGDARSCMLEMIQCWLINALDAKWSTIVQALAKIGNKSLAHTIALEQGTPTVGIADMKSESAALGENILQHPTETQRKLMQSVDDGERNIKSTDLKLRKQEQVLKKAEQNECLIKERLKTVKEMASTHYSRTEELMEKEIELEKALRFREAEIEILKESAKKERAYLIALREEEVAEYQKELKYVRQELERKKRKIPHLKEEIQQLLVELAKRSEENRHLRNSREESNAQLIMERERVEMKAKELTAAAVSHAVHMKEVQIQLAILEENKKQSMKKLYSLHDIVREKEQKIQTLSQKILAEEHQGKDQISMELADMKMNMIHLQNEIDQLRTTMKLSQKEASYYKEHTTSLLTDTPCRVVKLSLKWSDPNRAPEATWRGASVVHGTISYIIGHMSNSVYSYNLNTGKWSKHFDCPHINPGLVIINDLLTAVGGKGRDLLTNKLVSWNPIAGWREQFPPMQTARERPAVVHYGTYVIAMGGDQHETGVELLHIPSLLWSTVTSLPSPLKNITATLCHECAIAMDCYGSAYMMKMDLLISSIQSKQTSTGDSQWIPLPQCSVHCYAGYSGGPTLTTFHGQTVVVSYNGIFQLLEREWIRIGDAASVSMYDCMVCGTSDQMVVVGGLSSDFTPTNTVRVAVVG